MNGDESSGKDFNLRQSNDLRKATEEPSFAYVHHRAPSLLAIHGEIIWWKFNPNSWTFPLFTRKSIFLGI